MCVLSCNESGTILSFHVMLQKLYNQDKLVVFCSSALTPDQMISHMNQINRNVASCQSTFRGELARLIVHQFHEQGAPNSLQIFCTEHGYCVKETAYLVLYFTFLSDTMTIHMSDCQRNSLSSGITIPNTRFLLRIFCN